MDRIFQQMLGDPTLNLLINAGVAGLFAAFAIVQTRSFLKTVGEQRAASDASIVSQQVSNAQTLKEQAEQYFTFMREQREGFTLSLLGIAAQMEKLSLVTSQMNELLIRHDEHAEAAITQLVRGRRKKS